MNTTNPDTGCPKKSKTIEITYFSDLNALALMKKLKYLCKVRFSLVINLIISTILVQVVNNLFQTC